MRVINSNSTERGKIGEILIKTQLKIIRVQPVLPDFFYLIDKII